MLQLGVLHSSLLQDGDFGIGIVPQGKKILTGGLGFKGGLGFGAAAGENISPGPAKMAPAQPADG